MTILTIPSPILRTKSKNLDITEIDSKKIKNLCFAMIKTMNQSDGVGLSAPQIGKNIRLIAINTKDGAFCLINPKITKKSWAREWDQEGCLSVPGIYGKVLRHKKITCFYFNLKGKKLKLTAQGMLARVIQHETDHLNGILFIDKAKDIENQINPVTRLVRS